MFQHILGKIKEKIGGCPNFFDRKNGTVSMKDAVIPFLMLVIVFLIVITTIISQIKIQEFSYDKISEEVKSIKINEDMLKEYKFPKISTQIFSPLIIQQTKIEEPKIVVATPIIKESPKDPYEKYRNELNGYIGIGLMNQGGKTKVFLAKGEETYILGVGDVITDKLIVKEIAENHVSVGLTDDQQFQEVIKINK